MATKNKMVRTRLDDRTYKALKGLVDNFGITEYHAMQWAVECLLDKYQIPKNIPPKCKVVTVFVDNGMYGKLSEIAEEYNTTIRDAAWNCMISYIERIEKEKVRKETNDKNRQE